MEDAGTVELLVVLSSRATQSISVQFATVDGTAEGIIIIHALLSMGTSISTTRA